MGQSLKQTGIVLKTMQRRLSASGNPNVPAPENKSTTRSAPANARATAAWSARSPAEVAWVNALGGGETFTLPKVICGA